MSIFLFFRHGVVSAVVSLYDRLFRRRVEKPSLQSSGD